MISSLTAEGIKSEILYDANNNVTTQKIILDADTALSSSSAYDLLDQPTSTSIGSNPSNTRSNTVLRDKNGNIIESTDVRGLKTTFVYDDLDRVTQKKTLTDPTDPSKDIVTSYTYDANGNILTVVDPRGAVTTHTYDHFDRMISTTNSLGVKTSQTYNTLSLVTSMSTTDSTGNLLSKVERSYDRLGHVIRETV